MIVNVWESEQDTIHYRFTSEQTFVPPNTTVTLADGRRVAGPVLLVREPEIRRIEKP